jgi:hypothetical protein
VVDNRKFMKFLLIGLLLAIVAKAQDVRQPLIRLPLLLQYRDVTVTKVDPDGINITHDSGLAKVPFEKLSPELQAKFGGFDAAKAAEFRQQRKQDAHYRDIALQKAAEKKRLELDKQNATAAATAAATVARLAEINARKKKDFEDAAAAGAPNQGRIVYDRTMQNMSDIERRQLMYLRANYGKPIIFEPINSQEWDLKQLEDEVKSLRNDLRKLSR